MNAFHRNPSEYFPHAVTLQRRKHMLGRKTLLIILAVLFLILPFFASLLNLYIDWQYFAETGYAEVQITTLLAKIGCGLFFGVVMLAFLLSNLIPALRSKFPRSAITIMEGTLYQLKTRRARAVHQAHRPDCCWYPCPFCR